MSFDLENIMDSEREGYQVLTQMKCETCHATTIVWIPEDQESIITVYQKEKLNDTVQSLHICAQQTSQQATNALQRAPNDVSQLEAFIQHFPPYTMRRCTKCGKEITTGWVSRWHVCVMTSALFIAPCQVHQVLP